MLKGTIDYGSKPQLIGEFAKEFEVHQHISSRKETPIQSIFHDHNITILNVAKNVLYGAALGAGVSVLSYVFSKADKKIVLDRALFQHSFYLKKYAPNVVYGALAGFAWYLIHDLLLCSHGSATYNRFILSHAIMGSLVAATLWSPASFGVGAIGGAFVGLYRDFAIQGRDMLPPGFELEIVDFDKKQRERAIRDEIELEMSDKFRRSKGTLFTQHYVL